MRPLPHCLAALLLATPAMAQERFECELTTLCLDTRPCRDFAQVIFITLDAPDYTVEWEGQDLPSDYRLVAEIPPPEGSLEPVLVRTLMFENADTQAVQTITFDTNGNLSVVGAQPHVVPRVVTAFGQCDILADAP